MNGMQMIGTRRLVNPTTVVVFIIAFLLGYGTSSRIVNRNTGVESQEAAELEMQDQDIESSLAQISEAIGEGLNTVTADSQPAGESVVVAVELQKDGWVAVHEDMDGKPGRILGAQLFSAGANTGKVELLRATQGGKRYYAMLHADDGDGRFDHAKDLAQENAANAAITDEFMATAGAAIQ